jgi:hypothetical protein
MRANKSRRRVVVTEYEPHLLDALDSARSQRNRRSHASVSAQLRIFGPARHLQLRLWQQ